MIPAPSTAFVPMASTGVPRLAELIGRNDILGHPTHAVDAALGQGCRVPLAWQAQVDRKVLETTYGKLRDKRAKAAPWKQYKIDRYLEATELHHRLTNEPSPEMIDAYLSYRLRNKPLDLSGFSAMAREGLYVLFVDQGMSRGKVYHFLSQPVIAAHDRLRDMFLSIAVLLFNYRISNYSAVYENWGLIRESDKPWLLEGHLTEAKQALWFAYATHADAVSMENRYPIDYDQLLPAELALIEKYVTPYFPDYREHAEASVDYRVEEKGKTRIVELKSYRGVTLYLLPRRMAKQILQVFTYGLIARQEGFAGIEYILLTRSVDPSYEGLLSAALRATDVPFILRHEYRDRDYVIDQRKLQCSRASRPLIDTRTRLLPPIPSRSKAT